MLTTYRLGPAWAFVALIGSLPVTGQTVALRGKVWDPIQKSGIPGADIALTVGKVHRTTISVADGTYIVTGLKKGERVTATFRRAGYSPDPRRYEVVLSMLNNVKDVELLRDTADASYWGAWSGAIKSFVEASTTDPGRRKQIYNEAWEATTAFGISPEAQAAAARQLSAAAPESLGSSSLSSLAAVDPNTLRQFEAQIQAAIQGQAKLTKWDSISPDVAALVAASQLRKQPTSAIAEREFLSKYSDTWGPTGAQDVREKIALNPKQSIDWAMEQQYRPSQ